MDDTDEALSLSLDADEGKALKDDVGVRPGVVVSSGAEASSGGDATSQGRVDYCGDTSSSFADPLLFHMSGLLRLGSTRPLQNEDLGALRPDDAIDASYARLQRSWDMELALPKEQRSLPRALQRVVGWKIVAMGAFLQACANASDFAGPMILKALLQHLSPQPTGKLSPGMLWFLTGLMLFAPCFGTVCRQQATLAFTRIGCKLRNSLIALTFRKALLLSPLARSKNGGTINNIFSSDTENLQNFLTFLFPIMYSPFQIAVGLALVYQEVGPSTFLALAYLLFVMPGLVLCGMGFGIFIKKKLEESDRRIKMTKECLSGVRVLKYNAWELPFIGKLEAIRKIELVHIQSIFNCWIGISFVMDSLPLVCPILVFYAYSGLGNALTYSRAFTTLSLFTIITGGAALLPGVFTHVGYARAAAGRIQNLLNEEERVTFVVQDAAATAGAIVFNDASFCWLLETKEESAEDKLNDKLKDKLKDKEEGKEGYVHVATTDGEDVAAARSSGGNRSLQTLSNLSFAVPPGSLLAVVGPVGCGKSTLISALLNDCYCLSGPGSVTIKGTVSYHQQEPFILNATIRDNITFGLPLDEAKLASVLGLAALTVDLLSLPSGLDTEIGERGINLSGGQKARVSFARCLYKQADITLLDDPLSAVDASVCETLFRSGIKSLTKSGKTVVLVTHQVHLLPETDLILVLGKDGTLKAFGSYEHVVSLGIDLHQLVAAAVEEEGEEEDGVEGGEEGEGKESGDLKGGAPGGEGAASAPESQDMDKDNRLRARSSSVSSSRARKASDAAAAAKGDKGDKPEVEKKEGSRPPSAAGDKLITEEDRRVGMVRKEVYWWFARAGGLRLCYMIVVLCVAAKAVTLVGVFVLAAWGNENVSSGPAGLSSEENNRYLGLYALLLLSGLFITTIRTILATAHGVRGGSVFHSIMIHSVMKAPVSFYDVTPMGRILNRFTGDLQLADQGLTAFLVIVATLLCEIVAAVVAISIGTSGALLPLLVPLVYLYGKIQRHYRQTNTEVRRLLAISRSPVFTEIAQTLSGVSSLEAFNQTDSFIQRLQTKTDVFVAIQFVRSKINVWLNVRIDSLGAVVSFFVVMLCVSTNQSGKALIEPSSLAVALTYSFAIPLLLGQVFNMQAEIEGMMSGIERIKEYSDNLPKEEDAGCQPPPGWPSQGRIRFEGVEMRYRDQPLVLKGIDFEIAGSEKIGVAGRTGCGKSSLLVALFRIEPLCGGRILIDDVDIATVPLQLLRSKLCIIPQSPYLFNATIRVNLDPHCLHTDLEVWEVLDAVGLAEPVKAMPGGLLAEVADGGENLSVGQRQLICFARALLRKAKIVVLDEATASIDNEADHIIQQMLATRLADATVLTIAHRLNTIVNNTDRVLFLDSGKVVEAGPPHELISSKGPFSELWAQYQSSQQQET